MARGRRAREQADRDREVLAWIARFRFVDAEVLAERFSVSRQQINARVKRFDDAGLVARRGDKMGYAWTIAATAVGLGALGLPERKAARTDAQVDHELALARLVARLELDDPTTIVHTERDIRILEASGAGRFSVEVPGARGGLAKRWPDLVLTTPDYQRSAIELELTGKGSTRLRQILAAYAAVPWFSEVRFLAGSVPVARRLTRLIATLPPRSTMLDGRPTARLTVAPWAELPAAERDVIGALAH